MFLVGSTGQLLTLILTVGLPFIFLVSGQQKLEVADKSQIINIQFSQENQHVSDISSAHFADYTLEKAKVDFEIQTVCQAIKFPHQKERVKWKSIGLNHSGNKAPPHLSSIFVN